MNPTCEEKKHFDQLSSERQRNGFVPDLDRIKDSDFFYLSPFRRKALANLALRRTCNFLLTKLTSHVALGSKVLDLGCGSGWFSLELAKNGFHVTSVDLSEASIALARETLRGADLGNAGGSVVYHCADLNTWEVDRSDYEAVCYVGSLHHLQNSEAVVSRIKSTLKPNHYLVASEPLPFNYGDVEAAIGLLIRGILSACDSWYEEIPLPRTRDEFRGLMEDVRSEYVNWADKKEGNQSPLNNSSDGKDNMQAIEKHYRILEKHDVLPLQQRMIGGIRLGTDDKNLLLGKFITEIEEVLLANGAVNPGGFNLVGISL